MKNKKCKFCTAPFHGRSDKLFCSAQCKTYYHRELNSKAVKASKPVTKILLRNRSILYEILGDNCSKKKVNRLLLDKKKFNWQHYTSIHINTRNKIIYYVYDFAWMQFSDQEVLIIKLNNKISTKNNSLMLVQFNNSLKSSLK